MSSYHLPVMLAESIEHLNLRAGKVYVDATLGGGGHSLGMLKKEPKIQLFGFDQDESAICEATVILNGYKPTLIKSNFRNLRTQLAYRQIKGIDGILFDLGVSSHQLDEAERGFSFDKDARLDMRMDRELELSAADLVNGSDYYELKRIFKEYGEEAAAGKIAKAIIEKRAEGQIYSTAQLAGIIETVGGKGTKESLKTKVRIFQAIRIAVNDELNALQQALRDAINLLNPGGRIVVISYHSLEDRIVKNMFKEAETDCLCPPQIIHCICNHKSKIKVLTRRPLSPSEEEIGSNIRARSAKLRVAEKKGKK